MRDAQYSIGFILPKKRGGATLACMEDSDSVPIHRFPEPPEPMSDEEIVEETQWMCDHHPEFMAFYSLDQLEPDKYPEHRVIAEFLRNRNRLKLVLDDENRKN